MPSKRSSPKYKPGDWFIQSASCCDGSEKYVVDFVMGTFRADNQQHYALIEFDVLAKKGMCSKGNPGDVFLPHVLGVSTCEVDRRRSFSVSKVVGETREASSKLEMLIKTGKTPQWVERLIPHVHEFVAAYLKTWEKFGIHQLKQTQNDLMNTIKRLEEEQKSLRVLKRLRRITQAFVASKRIPGEVDWEDIIFVDRSGSKIVVH